MHSEAANSAR